MLTSMTTRCDQCGHESESRYRFCGMCGAKLPPPPSKPVEGMAARPDRDEPIRSVGAPSFLGLSEEPTSSVTYLLEDELSTSHWGRTVVLILVLVALGIAGWYWRNPLRAYVTAKLAQAPANNQVDGSPPPAEAIAAPAPEAPPAITNTSQPKPESSVTDLPASSAPSTATAAPNPAAVGPPPDAPPQAAPPDQPAEPPVRAAQDEAPRGSQISKNTEPQVQKPSPAPPAGDQLEAEGERYLYGTGVPVNCSRALKDLIAAAGQGSTKAYSVLGTIYATGHCTDRDLPLAYHWFAKALQQDSSNTRLQRDLQVLWSQMTPDERQIAMSTKH
jgi:hypothetical protein